MQAGRFGLEHHVPGLLFGGNMQTQTQPVIRSFGDNLILRRATLADAELLSQFNAKIHGEDPYDERAVYAWTHDLLTGPHPTFQTGDFLLVEDLAAGKIVSSLCTISQTWAMEGISFGVGRPELVGTDPEYRNRGLVRAQFEVVHEWSRQRGELIQVITGIPFYYRQFGYEMTLELSGGRVGFEPNLPLLKNGEEEKYRFRPVDEADLPWMVTLYQQECTRSMVSAVRDLAMMRHEVFENSAENVNRLEFRVIETPAGQPVGYIAHPGNVWGTMQSLYHYTLQPGASYLDVTPSVIRYLWATGMENAPKREKTLKSYAFWFGTDHPSYVVASGQLPLVRNAYAFYVRVPDLPAFLRRIAPALEKRLANSSCPGYTGELKISFYRGGVRLVFEKGVLAAVEDWRPAVKTDEGAAAFPNLTFLQLLFGYRSLAEIRYAFPDCHANDEARALLEALFPKKASRVWSIT
jgi:hypothetical protein